MLLKTCVVSQTSYILSTCIIFKTITIFIVYNEIPNFSYGITCLDDICRKYQITGIICFIKIFTIGRTHFFCLSKATEPMP